MVYKERLVATIKCKGNILREDGDIVYLPFGSEYSILLKNLDSRKALVNIKVDGREVISDLIIEPGQNTEIERFFEGSMNRGHRLKFIEKTKDIEDYRDNKIEDGIVQISYRFEKNEYISYRPYTSDIFYEHYSDHGFTDWRFTYGGRVTGETGILYGSTGNIESNINPVNCSYSCQRNDQGITVEGNESNQSFRYGDIGNIESNINPVNCSYSCQRNDQGITVEGNESNQSFRYGDIGPLESTMYHIIIQLKGETLQSYVNQPLTVKTKLRCKYCGKVSNSTAKFCFNCGAALI